MAGNKVGVIYLLLLSSAILLVFNPEIASAKVSPQYCTQDAGYMTCPSSGNKQLNPPCNCCLAPKGCTVYHANGTAICTGT
ncbi:hypothetical protein ACB098_01G122100 [Castanea mollissima]